MLVAFYCLSVPCIKLDMHRGSYVTIMKIHHDMTQHHMDWRKPHWMLNYLSYTGIIVLLDFPFFIALKLLLLLPKSNDLVLDNIWCIIVSFISILEYWLFLLLFYELFPQICGVKLHLISSLLFFNLIRKITIHVSSLYTDIWLLTFNHRSWLIFSFWDFTFPD